MPTIPNNTTGVFVGIVGQRKGMMPCTCPLDSTVVEESVEARGKGNGRKEGEIVIQHAKSTLNAQILKHGLNLSRS